MTWVPSDMNLGDALTKVHPDALRVIQLYLDRRTWCVRFADEFVSARQAQRLRKLKGKANEKLNALIHHLPEEDVEEDLAALPSFDRHL